MVFDKHERIIVPDENGDEHLFEVFFTFHIDQTNQSYVAMVPVEQLNDEEMELYAFRYEANDKDDFSLFPIEFDEEWDMVEEMLNTLADEDLLDA